MAGFRLLAAKLGFAKTAPTVDRFDVQAHRVRAIAAREEHDAAKGALEATQRELDAATLAFDETGSPPEASRVSTAQLHLARAERVEAAKHAAVGGAQLALEHAERASAFLGAVREETSAAVELGEASEGMRHELAELLVVVARVNATARRLDAARARAAAARDAADHTRARTAEVDAQIAGEAPRVIEPEAASISATRARADHVAAVAAALVTTAGVVAQHVVDLVVDQRAAANALSLPPLPELAAQVLLERASYRAPTAPPSADIVGWRWLSLLVRGNPEPNPNAIGGLAFTNRPLEDVVDFILDHGVEAARAQLCQKPAPMGRGPRGYYA